LPAERQQATEAMETDADVTSAAADGSRDRALPTDRFRPDIEGLRAVAVGLVLLDHLATKWVTGGYIGVDIFFVISGFLITRQLLRQCSATNGLSLTEFYARRVRRILPAATVTILATIFAAYYWQGASAGNRVGKDGQWAAAFGANIHFPTVLNSEAGSHLPASPLFHFWSLGVEEQFYLVWPGFILVLACFGTAVWRRRSLAVAVAMIIVASFAWSVFLTPRNLNWAYESTLTRAWQLAAGAAIAVLIPAGVRARPRWLIEFASLAGAMGIVACALLLTKTTLYPGSMAAWPIISSALLIAAGCASTSTLVSRTLAFRPLQWLGSRSYSIYLWHFPVLIMAGLHPGHLVKVQKIALVVLILVVANLSYRFIEKPIRNSDYFKRRTGLTLATGGVLVVATIAMAQLMIVTHG
jgi:peptidoglycan/LPS O-acetylase OafA/YrhL